jgi:hypothetical protein
MPPGITALAVIPTAAQRLATSTANSTFAVFELPVRAERRVLAEAIVQVVEDHGRPKVAARADRHDARGARLGERFV